ncbi:MAG: hypothetical protein ACPGVK_07315 [Halocynthiibacter sp.]
MGKIQDLEARLTEALKRIESGATQLQLPVENKDDVEKRDAEHARVVEDLQTALSDEKLVTAQLEERLTGVNATHETALADKEAALAKMREENETLHRSIAQLRDVNGHLRGNADALREANEQGVGDAHLINKTMQTELESLRAERRAEALELENIATALADAAPKDGETEHA